MKTLASIFLAICVMLFSGCVSAKKERLQLVKNLAQIAPCDVKLEFDNPEEILNTAYRENVVSGLKPKDRFETQEEYEQRIAATGAETNLEGKTFTILIPVSLIQYAQSEENSTQWFIVLKKEGSPSFAAIEKKTAESATPTRCFIGTDELGRDIYDNVIGIDSYFQVLELKLQNTTAMAWQLKKKVYLFGLRPDETEWGNPYHFGLLIEKNDADFRQKMRDSKISLAIRFTIKNIQHSYIFYRTDYSHYEYNNDTRKVFTLPVDVTEVWAVDTTTNTAFAHWSSGE